MTTEITLKDASGQNKPLKAKIMVTEHNILVSFEGYGEKTAADKCGSPIYIENVNGMPRLVVWGDINDEEPTHIISLDDAAESNRKESM